MKSDKRRRRDGELTPASSEHAGEELEAFFDLSRTLFCVAGLDGYFKRLNPAWERTLRFTRKELMAKPYVAFVHPDDAAVTTAEGERLADGSETICFENRYRAKDGSWHWLAWSAKPDLAKKLIYATATDVTERKRLEDDLRQANANQRDISDRKRAEEAIRESREDLRRLAARLQSVREEERTYLAREVHDELGQALTGLKMDLAWLLRKPPVNETDLRDRVQTMVGVVDATIGRVRRLSARLRPAVLDDLGLVAAVEWQVQETGGKSGLEYALDLPLEDVDVDPEVATAVFRILQEALTNIVRHADARHFEVKLSTGDEQLVLEVRDDGKGVGDEGLRDHESLGFIGMRERAEALGGKLDIARDVEGGTVVKLSLSLGQSDRAP